jgi:hypothetical protein
MSPFAREFMCFWYDHIIIFISIVQTTFKVCSHAGKLSWAVVGVVMDDDKCQWYSSLALVKGSEVVISCYYRWFAQVISCA